MYRPIRTMPHCCGNWIAASAARNMQTIGHINKYERHAVNSSNWLLRRRVFVIIGPSVGRSTFGWLVFTNGSAPLAHSSSTVRRSVGAASKGERRRNSALSFSLRPVKLRCGDTAAAAELQRCETKSRARTTLGNWWRVSEIVRYCCCCCCCRCCWSWMPSSRSSVRSVSADYHMSHRKRSH